MFDTWRSGTRMLSWAYFSASIRSEVRDQEMQEAAKKRSFGEETVFTSFEAPPPRTVTIDQKQSMVLPRLETISFLSSRPDLVCEGVSQNTPRACVYLGARKVSKQ